MMDFPNSPTAGQSFTSGGTTWVWTVPPSAWKATAGPAGGAASFLPLTGGTLAGPGNLTVRGGILGGAAGTVPAAGSMLLNANTVAPPAGLSPNLYVVGGDATSPSITVDSFGTGNPFISGRQARGTAAAPTASQANDTFLALRGTGRGATAYGNSGVGNPRLDFRANENWTDTAQGSCILFYTAANGSTSLINSLTLAGNSATFSGTVITGSGAINSYVTFMGAVVGSGWNTSGPGPFIFGDTNVVGVKLGPGNNSFQVQPNNSTTSTLTADSGGGLTITGGATKPGGGSWTAPSSRDIKEDIQSYSQGLQAVLALKPVSYRYDKSTGYDAGETHIGLVHDETAHMPEMHTTAVIGGTPDKPGREVDALDCSAITFALVNAIRELKAEIDALKAAGGAG